MAEQPPKDVWAAGDAYEPYVGRWSRLVARDFVDWLAIPPGRDWIDVGCGTGALSGAILAQAEPRSVAGIDPSSGFIAFAQRAVADARATFQVGDAQGLPAADATADAVVSGLVLNFVPDPARAVHEMRRVLRPGGAAAVYVWDYAGEMQLMRHFWNAAVALNPEALALDEGRRFPICQPERLRGLFADGGFADIETRAIDVPTLFADFDDYWMPFLGGQAPAPGYCMSLTPERREALRQRIKVGLPIAADGSIALVARAFACRGRRA